MPHAAPENTVSIVVSEHWLDQFCEHVGSLCAVLQALSKIPGHDRPHTLATEALENCASLQDLLNDIPVWGGSASSGAPLSARPSSNSWPEFPASTADLLRAGDDFEAGELGDSFPEFVTGDENILPAIDQPTLEETCEHDSQEMRAVLDRFCQRCEGDLRQLEMLSVGHDWTRLSRLAGVLKDSAARVAAARIVVDAAALQGAARIGCRHDVDLALDALRADLRACVQQVQSWCVAETSR